jgi:hypothetical protein
MPWRERLAQRERREHPGEQRVDAAREAKQGAVPDTIPSHPEKRREQRPEPRQSGNDDQLLHRTRGGEHVPAEDQRLHLEGPRRGKVGRPLETEAAHGERRCHRRMLQAGPAALRARIARQ